MDMTTLALLVLTGSLLLATWLSRRIGNERRDVGLMAFATVSLAAATAFSAAV